MTTERWPPVYDAKELATTINKLVDSNQLKSHFFDYHSHDLGPCQGDIIWLATNQIPVLDEIGQPSIYEDDFCSGYWMIVGNTCDIARNINNVEWTQIIPLLDLGTDNEINNNELAALMRYRHSRRFYVPAWSNEVSGHHFVADFLKPVTIHKTALFEVAEIKAKLSYYGWMLLHSCLVRFLARDDGRFD